MARILVGGGMVRHPHGGISHWLLTWLIGLRQLGHDVYYVEKSGWPFACYHPPTREWTDDCRYGVRTAAALLRRFDLQDRWCFVDAEGTYHGLTRTCVTDIFRSADVFLDFWSALRLDSEWRQESLDVPLRVLIDGEPAHCQIKMENSRRAGDDWPIHHRFFSVGCNIGTPRSSSPTAGRSWEHLINPVMVDWFPVRPAETTAPFTTVMNWTSLKHLEFDGQTYGQKERQFVRFIDLPRRTTARMEVAVSGQSVPTQELKDHGWHVLDADDLSVSVEAYRSYILQSKGEFSVAKHVSVAMNSGWIDDREGC
jgi:hypothetical protein